MRMRQPNTAAHHDVHVGLAVAHRVKQLERNHFESVELRIVANQSARRARRRQQDVAKLLGSARHDRIQHVCGEQSDVTKKT